MRRMTSNDYLRPTEFLDWKTPSIEAKANELTHEGQNETEKAKTLFYFVRDEIRYKIPLALPEKTDLIASHVLARGYGYCIPKASLLASLCRVKGIPARLYFADLKNHLLPFATMEALGTNVMVYHAYNEIFLDGSWVKATPAFNKSLCEKHGLVPVEFSGTEDAMFSETDLQGRRHMEYVKDRGHSADVPFDDIVQTFIQAYGKGYNNHMSSKE